MCNREMRYYTDLHPFTHLFSMDKKTANHRGLISELVGLNGIEPSTSRLSSVRSNQLS